MMQPDHAIATLGEQDVMTALMTRIQRLDDEIRQLLEEVDQALARHASFLASLKPRAISGWSRLPAPIMHTGSNAVH